MIIDITTAPGEDITHEEKLAIADAVQRLGHSLDFIDVWTSWSADGRDHYAEKLRAKSPGAVRTYERRTYAAGFKPAIAEISRRLGIELELTYTGGGCMALEGLLIGPSVRVADFPKIMVTDYQDGILSPVSDSSGYWVGIYETDSDGDYSEATSIYGEIDCTPEALPFLVEKVVRDYRKGIVHTL